MEAIGRMIDSACFEPDAVFPSSNFRAVRCVRGCVFAREHVRVEQVTVAVHGYDGVLVAMRLHQNLFGGGGR